jgi:capsular exopolysaccharide synthesis family protein
MKVGEVSMDAGQNFQNLPINGSVHRSGEPAVGGSDMGGESAEAKPKGGLKLRPIIAMVRRNILLIGGLTAAFTGVGYLLYKGSPLTYQGNFTLLVEPITSQARSTDPYVLSRAQNNDTSGSSIDYPTLLQVLQSPELLDKIAEQIKTKYPKVTAASLANDLKNQDLTVIRIGTNLLDSTRTIDVGYKGANAEQVQFILEKLAEGYLRFSLEDRKTRIGGGVEFIEDQLPALQQRVNSLESQIQAIRQRYRFTDPTVETQQVSDRLKVVREKKLEGETLFREQESLYGSLYRQLELTPQEGLAAASLSQNPRYQDLLNQQKKIESQIKIVLARYTEESEVFKRLDQQRKNLEQLLRQEAQQNLGQSSPRVVGSSRVLAYQDSLRVGLIQQIVQADNQRRALQARNNEIFRTEAELDRRLTELPAIIRQYNALTQQLTIATQTLNQFLLQRETLRVEAAQKEVPWEIISKPKLMRDAVSGKVIEFRGKKAQQFLFMGVGLGLALGLGAALLREKLRNRFATAEDLQDAVQYPFLGNIPLLRLNTGAIGSSNKFMNVFSDAFSSLYTNLRFLDSSTPVRSISISSVEPGDGKTTVALNLATTAAAMGQRVLLVDANLRAPQMHTLLELSNHKGLVDVLRQTVKAEDAIQRSSVYGHLSILTAGGAQLEATKLFASSEMQRLVKQLQSTFDLVIYDTPALDGLTDTNFLVSQTDGMLMVVGVNKTKRSRFMGILESVKKYRLPVIGVIANHVGKGQIASYLPEQQAIQEQQTHPAFFGNLKESSDIAR